MRSPGCPSWCFVHTSDEEGVTTHVGRVARGSVVVVVEYCADLPEGERRQALDPQRDWYTPESARELGEAMLEAARLLEATR